MSATKVIAVTFALIILVGALLLSLPIASRDGISCGFRPALFTATSATCVTGLVLYDTYTQWSGFGQIVIITLIQVGGLGFMSAATLVVFALRRKVGLKQRLLIAQALSVNDMDGIVNLQKTVLVGSFSIEAIGAVILTLRFWPEYGFATALKWGCFHSVSAFCNAGFDIFGCITPGASLMEFQSDPIVLLTLGALITVGGLGFLVWEEIATLRSFRKFSVYTRLVLVTTLTLILAGWVLTCILEWNNPGTLGPMSIPDKLLNGLFQSLTLRTAGFASVDQALLTDSGKAVSMVLMLIGGSSGSTAGGLKTVTFVVLVLFLLARIRDKETVCVYKRTIPASQVMDAMTIAAIMIGLAMFGGVFISATSPVGFTDALYEAISALATVGLTAGATGSLSIPGQILIIIYMYFGRVGVLTISLGFLVGDRAEERFRYAETNLLIG
ncbi:MAG: potassium uptake protein, TrkH family [Oscillospiraceae bacterium]|nr:potassium uptake protein, TrkH family [Oscillospiraceae bacterium]